MLSGVTGKTKYRDKRLDAVEDLLLNRMVSRKTVCLKKLANGRSEEVRYGRFLNNRKVSKNPMIREEKRRTNAASSGRHVLAIMDTTELNYEHHRGKVRGLGTVGNGKDKGMFLHPGLVLDANDGGGIGFSGLNIWNRTKSKAKNYKSLPIEEKESYRWLDVGEQTKKCLSNASHITLITDREGDMYEMWDRIPNDRTSLLVRACRDRKLNKDFSLFAYAQTLAVQSKKTIKIREQLTKSAREAQLCLSYKRITLPKPKNCSDINAKSSVDVNLVYVREESEAISGKPVCWRLLTTHEINNEEDAWQVVDWYRQRWQIEQLFRTMKKKGLDIESSHVESAKALETLTIMALIAAFRVMQLVLARDGTTKQKTADLFNKEEIFFLDVVRRKYEGKTQKQKNPHKQESLAWASWIIARLGGWKGYKSERPPGPITMKDGLKYFEALYSGWLMSKDVCIP